MSDEKQNQHPGDAMPVEVLCSVRIMTMWNGLQGEACCC
jgi:hypothetical protein